MFFSNPILPKEKKDEYEIFFCIVLKDERFFNDIEFISPENFSSKVCYAHEYKIGNEDSYLIVYYAEILKEKDSKVFEVKFKIKSDEYIISMKIKSKISFIFKPDIEKISFFRNKKIDQLIIGYRDKFIGFYESLITENKENYLNNLALEGINTFEGDNTFVYFILILSHCYKDNEI